MKKKIGKMLTLLFVLCCLCGFTVSAEKENREYSLHIIVDEKTPLAAEANADEFQVATIAGICAGAAVVITIAYLLHCRKYRQRAEVLKREIGAEQKTGWNIIILKKQIADMESKLALELWK